MNIYKNIKYFNNIKSPRLKLFGIYLLHILKKRYLGIFIDPVLSCNLRCRMCYFSDEEKRKTLKGKLENDDLENIAKALFPRGLKVQIGCGAEPTVSKSIPLLIALSKKYGVPYVSLTTNGILLTEENIREYLSGGLDEITLSMHGVKKETYEYFMTNSDYDVFSRVLKYLSDAKKTFPDFKIRINYTMNEDNFLELKDFFTVFGTIDIDVLQLRPIQKMGETAYNNFNHEQLEKMYDSTIRVVKEECVKRNITCIAPEKVDISDASENMNSVVMESAYCYISSRGCWETGFDYRNETYESYAKRVKLSRRLFKNIFFRKKDMMLDKKHLNYDIT
ncbi:MAG: radical SAM protein [Candidatus Azobacteroides sp.]|nr:radical SAM protein [Candidatus Azobacteroides sp.]